MSDLVRVNINGTHTNVGRAFAEKRELEILADEPTHNKDGSIRGATLSPQKQAAVDRAASTETTGATTTPAKKKAAASPSASTAEEAS